MKYYFALLMSLLSYVSQAQTPNSIKHIIYFASDQDTLTSKDIIVLSDFVQENIEGTNSIHLIGHTDNIGPASYNLKLSKRRVEATHAQLAFLLGDQELDSMIIGFKGEEEPIASNLQVLERAANRRVEIYFMYPKVEGLQGGEVANFIKSIPLRAPSNAIINSVGMTVPDETPAPMSQITVNGVNFSCGNGSVLKGGGGAPEMVRTGEQAYHKGLTTITSAGEPLRSEGMFRVSPCGAEAAETALLEPVTVDIPIEPGNTGTPDLFEIDGNGNWKAIDMPINIVEQGGQRFYRVETMQCGWINLDRKIKDTIKIEIEPARKIALEQVNIVCNGPNYNYNLALNNRKAEGTVFEPATIPDSRITTMVYYAITEAGEKQVYKIPLQDLNASRKERWYPTIDNKRVSWFTSLFKKTTKKMYVHYKITAQDLAAVKPMALPKTY
ncbi:MAG: OmpA family protein [Aureispira sp.]